MVHVSERYDATSRESSTKSWQSHVLFLKKKNQSAHKITDALANGKSMTPTTKNSKRKLQL